RGATTEIEAINGWLLCQAKNQGMDLPSHRRLVEALTSTP
ncbi:ketopantoate reductase C-terminal domain-containing protein, partial [Alcanivorax sp.]